MFEALNQMWKKANIHSYEIQSWTYYTISDTFLSGIRPKRKEQKVNAHKTNAEIHDRKFCAPRHCGAVEVERNRTPYRLSPILVLSSCLTGVACL